MSRLICYLQNPELASAITRYLYFVLDIAFDKPHEMSCNLKLLILIDENINLDIEQLNSIQDFNNVKLIIFGTDSISTDSYINILNFKGFKNNLKAALNNINSTFLPLIYVKEIKHKLNLFIRGHGDNSPLNALNWTRYYLGNGFNLLNNSKLTSDEYENMYLKPGLEYWEIFKRIITKYLVYLNLIGFENQLKQIKGLADEFESFISTLKKKSTEKHQDLNELTIKKNIDYLNQIDYIFMKIHENIIGNYESIQHISR